MKKKAGQTAPAKQVRRPPNPPSPRTLERLLRLHADMLESMTKHLRPVAITSRRVAREVAAPQCLAFLPVHKTSAQLFESALLQQSRRSWTGIALLRWPDGFSATLQLAYLIPKARGSKAAWFPLTMASGALTKTLLRLIRKRDGLAAAILLTVPHLRLQVLATQPEPGARLLLVQPGTTRLKRAARFTIATFCDRLLQECDRVLAAHPPQLVSAKKLLTGRTPAARH